MKYPSGGDLIHENDATKLISCTACSNQVSREATNCPQCRNPINKSFVEAFLRVVAGLILIFLSYLSVRIWI
jgi:hypothetical protein